MLPINDIDHLEKLGYLWLVTNNKLKKVISITQMSMSGREHDKRIKFDQVMQEDRAGILAGSFGLRLTCSQGLTQARLL